MILFSRSCTQYGQTLPDELFRVQHTVHARATNGKRDFVVAAPLYTKIHKFHSKAGQVLPVASDDEYANQVWEQLEATGMCQA